VPFQAGTYTKISGVSVVGYGISLNGTEQVGFNGNGGVTATYTFYETEEMGYNSWGGGSTGFYSGGGGAISGGRGRSGWPVGPGGEGSFGPGGGSLGLTFGGGTAIGGSITTKTHVILTVSVQVC
jgi:hypothetical protein